MKKLIMGTMAAATLGLSIGTLSGPAEARSHHGGHNRHMFIHVVHYRYFANGRHCIVRTVHHHHHTTTRKICR